MSSSSSFVKSAVITGDGLSSTARSVFSLLAARILSGKSQKQNIAVPAKQRRSPPMIMPTMAPAPIPPFVSSVTEKGAAGARVGAGVGGRTIPSSGTPTTIIGKSGSFFYYTNDGKFLQVVDSTQLELEQLESSFSKKVFRKEYKSFLQVFSLRNIYKRYLGPN